MSVFITATTIPTARTIPAAKPIHLSVVSMAFPPSRQAYDHSSRRWGYLRPGRGDLIEAGGSTAPLSTATTNAGRTPTPEAASCVLRADWPRSRSSGTWPRRAEGPARGSGGGLAAEEGRVDQPTEPRSIPRWRTGRISRVEFHGWELVTLNGSFVDKLEATHTVEVDSEKRTTTSSVLDRGVPTFTASHADHRPPPKGGRLEESSQHDPRAVGCSSAVVPFPETRRPE